MSLDTDKHWIRELAATCAVMGVNKVVISPGSRCAPLTIAFNRHPGIECLSIIDERSAAFFALGMAQQLQEPVALVCTSGSAVLNYAPAIAEAYYQGVPLVIFTADRPPELIDQGDGQTIRQNEVYRNYIKRSFQLPVDVNDKETLELSNGIVAEAIRASMHAGKGPVHVNVPLREPLYELKEYESISSTAGNVILAPITIAAGNNAVASKELGTLLKVWQNSPRKLIVAGGYAPSPALQKGIEQLSNDVSVTVVAEITANLQGPGILNCPDALLSAPLENGLKEADLIPDLLITFGGGIVSKKLKALLRAHPIKEHWHIHPAGQPIDTYQHLTQAVAMEPETFFGYLADHTKPVAGGYQNSWLQLQERSQKQHDKILEEDKYNDLKVFNLLMNNLPKGSNVHLGNSTPIRYAGLFEPKPGYHVTYNCNRGTSGIDGTVSTAAGAAKVNDRLTTIITGDLAFFYDSNALWNKHLPGNLRIIIMNNGGGNIFRVLQGPSQMPELEEFFETKMNLRAENIALTYGLPYYFCDHLKGLEELLPRFFQPHNGKCAILEIKTPAEESALAMRRYLNING